MSIANKIYTFPKVILSISDIISSSDEENPLQIFKQPQLGEISNFKKRKYPAHSTLNNLNDSLKHFESGTLKEGRTVDTKKGKDKFKNNDSSYKKREEESK